MVLPRRRQSLAEQTKWGDALGFRPTFLLRSKLFWSSQATVTVQCNPFNFGSNSFTKAGCKELPCSGRRCHRHWAFLGFLNLFRDRRFPQFKAADQDFGIQDYLANMAVSLVEEFNDAESLRRELEVRIRLFPTASSVRVVCLAPGRMASCRCWKSMKSPQKTPKASAPKW